MKPSSFSFGSSAARALRIFFGSWRSTVWVFLVLASPLAAEQGEPAPAAAEDQSVQSLFDGKTLGQWEIVDQGEFAGHGQVRVQDASLVLNRGAAATGVRWNGPFPKSDYELTLEGKRVAGDDFFCGLTFPVGDQSLTLILGGWGGWVVGLSCIDDQYAIDNNTCQAVQFQNDRWYRIRLRVRDSKIEVWVDDKPIIELEAGDQKLAVGQEMEPCLPLGLATWRTTGALRKMQVRSPR